MHTRVNVSVTQCINASMYQRINAPTHQRTNVSTHQRIPAPQARRGVPPSQARAWPMHGAAPWRPGPVWQVAAHMKPYDGSYIGGVNFPDALMRWAMLTPPATPRDGSPRPATPRGARPGACAVPRRPTDAVACLRGGAPEAPGALRNRRTHRRISCAVPRQ